MSQSAWHSGTRGGTASRGDTGASRETRALIALAKSGSRDAMMVLLALARGGKDATGEPSDLVEGRVAHRTQLAAAREVLAWAGGQPNELDHAAIEREEASLAARRPAEVLSLYERRARELRSKLGGAAE